MLTKNASGNNSKCSDDLKCYGGYIFSNHRSRTLKPGCQYIVESDQDSVQDAPSSDRDIVQDVPSSDQDIVQDSQMPILILNRRSL